MKGGVRFSIAGLTLLLALAGCGRGFLNYGERAAWRHQAEATCMRSGEVKLGAGVVQISPIEGPGVCGADFPLRVAALGEGSAVGYADELRPPASIGGPASQMPNWPVRDARYYAPPQVAPVETQPIQRGNMRWVPGPQPAVSGQDSAPAGQPMSLDPPGAMPLRPSRIPEDATGPTEPTRPSDLRTQPAYNAPAYRPASRADDIPDDAILPANRARRSYPPAQPAYNAPVYQQPRTPPALGPARDPNAPVAAVATLSPPATLACPIVSALDRWVSAGVQPAALHWFGSPVVEIKQISAYSCRGMVGTRSSHISEHAFGNALDVAGFVLADGRKITVVKGWRGTPEEQGFLHDVQLYACETFNTVLGPGYNAAHYNHLHLDLMRRASGRRPCRPNAIPGEVVAARARAVYASHGRGPAYTGSIKTPVTIGDMIRNLPEALPGEDGYVADADDDAATGSIPEPAAEEPKPVKERGLFDRWFGGGSTQAGVGAGQDRMGKGY